MTDLLNQTPQETAATGDTGDTNDRAETVLTKLAIKAFGNQKQNKRITQDVTRERHLDSKSGKWLQTKFPPEALKPVTSKANRIREAWKLYTLPFDDGERIASETALPQLRDAIETAIEERANTIETHLIDRYDEWLDEARRMHNGDFRPELYPSRDELRARFRVEFSVRPFPQSTHFESHLADIYGNQLDSLIESRTQDAIASLWEQMLAPVSKMAETLANPDAIFRNSLVENIQDICDRVPLLNLRNDPAIERAANEIRTLCERDPDEFRNAPAIRKETAEKAAALAAKFSASVRSIDLD